MSSFAGSNVLCQSGIDLTLSGVEWLSGPINVHGVYLIPSGADTDGLQYVNLYDGDPEGSSSTLLFQIPCTWAPLHEMQGAIYFEIPMNGIRFSDGVYVKIEGNSGSTPGDALPNGLMLFYTGAFQTIGSSP